ncbi:uroporphyrinogen-III C-methyltransferase [Steroidobacter denitrificans]|nr:uroporphyrinogen-III C-methyltransferase [Steroidobacter denitrificans]
MTDEAPHTHPIQAPPAEPPKTQPASHGWMATALAVLALIATAYTLFRLDATHDRLDGLRDALHASQQDRDALRTQFEALAEQERQAREDISRRLDALDDTPRQLQDLAAAIETLRGRSEGPERAWSRAEAMFLLELAQRRLTLERDIDTAIAALEAADSRLAALRDQSFAPVRQQIARELQSLRAVNWPDTTGLLARLTSAEEYAGTLSPRDMLAHDAQAHTHAQARGGLSRAWSIARESLAKLIVVRHVEDRDATVMTAQQRTLRRQHLQLLLFSARTAIARHDEAGYRNALVQARRWLEDFFDSNDLSVRTLLEEIQALEPVDIDPPLPDISASSRTLRRLTPDLRGQQ